MNIFIEPLEVQRLSVTMTLNQFVIVCKDFC